ncbi:MAG: DUF1592 domain-containing protein [Verrucomicrobiales bacterium]
MRIVWQTVMIVTQLLVAGCSGDRADSEQQQTGLVIYRQHCVECHGEKGGGNPLEEIDALYGKRSMASLARFVERNMPEDEPELCVGTDAHAVAKYIYDAFYSPGARKRMGLHEAGAIGFSRMTGIQYRNAIADLVARAGPQVPEISYEPGGLRGYYFNSKGMNKKEGKSVNKIDPFLEFDFGEKGPADGISREQFSIVWEGSFYVRDTGYYEFRTSTPNGLRLYVNTVLRVDERNYRDDSSKAAKQALIDDWVSSGPEVRQSAAKIFLLGGRRYPIRLDYFKYKEKIGKIRLEWKPPHGTWTVFGGDVISSTIAPRTFVVSAIFPVDDRSQGYERGTLVSKGWHEGVTAGAIETAGEITDRLEEFSGVRENDPQHNTKLRDFCARFAEAAFRRPLGQREAGFFVDRQFNAAGDVKVAVKRCVLLCLKSPRFLYPELSGEDEIPDAYTVASRLSFAVWDSIPDAKLLQTAASGGLGTAESVDAEAWRMLEDPRARAKMNSFFEHWLEMEERDPAKDRSLFPGFSDAVIMDLRESLLRFVNNVVWSERSDYRDLLKAEYLLLNERLCAIYGGDVVGTGLKRVAVDPAHRAGILTHPYLLALFAYHDNTSPIHRGVFLTRNILGRMLRPPPKAIAFSDDKLDPQLSMREKITLITRDTACMSCHSVINPLGFTLENFDAIGRWRMSEKDKRINAKSDYMTAAGDLLSLSGARDIADFAAGSPAAHGAFINAVFNHLAKQPIAAYGSNSLIDLRKGFSASLFNIKALMVEIAKLHALRDCIAPDAASPQPAG